MIIPDSLQPRLTLQIALVHNEMDWNERDERLRDNIEHVNSLRLHRRSAAHYPEISGASVTFDAVFLFMASFAFSRMDFILSS